MSKKKPSRRPADPPSQTVEVSVVPGLPPDVLGVAREESLPDGPIEPGEPEPGSEPEPESEALPVVRAVPIEAPLAEDAGTGYLTRHLEVGRLTLAQKTAQRRLLLGLVAAGEQLHNGSPVRTNADAWRWVLEQLAANGGDGVTG